MKLIEFRASCYRDGARYRYDCKNCYAHDCNPQAWSCPYNPALVPDPPAKIRQKQNLRRFNQGYGLFKQLPFKDGESLKLLPASYSALAMRLKMEEP